jgi:Uma2 family endonuclease
MTTGIAYEVLSPEQLAVRWRQLQREPGGPDFCEIDAYGDIIEMNPPAKRHQRIVWALQQQLVERLGGEALPGIGVVTRIGVRVPDVCWQPRPTDDDPAQPAPDICVEVRSPDNTRAEFDAKIAAYLQAGCREAILVELTGRVRFFGTEGERAASAFGLRLQVPSGTYPR